MYSQFTFQNEYNLVNNKPIINIIFNSNFGEIHNIKFYYGTTIKEILIHYLTKIGRRDLIGAERNKITFLFNSNQLNFEDETKIETFFHKLQCPKIFVNIINNNFHNKSQEEKSIKSISNINIFQPSFSLSSKSHLYNGKDELNQSLKDEQLKNKKLNDEIYLLRKELEVLRFELQKMNVYKEKYQKLKKNNEQKEYLITSIHPGEKIIAVNFVSMGVQDIGHYNLICKNNDLFIKLEERLYKDFPDFKKYNTFFKVNNKIIKRFKTMDENNIKNNDVISIFIMEEFNE